MLINGRKFISEKKRSSFCISRRISELEGVEIQSKQEIARLREISEVATFQIGAINDIKVLDEKEFQSLRLQLLDLQSKSDDKSEIGKLHRHILALQISEATAKRRQLLSDNDLAKQKALLLRTEQKLDEKEQSLFFIRQEYTQRIRYLRTALQVNFSFQYIEFRRKFSLFLFRIIVINMQVHCHYVFRNHMQRQ
jgi:centrosomal protein CEP290